MCFFVAHMGVVMSELKLAGPWQEQGLCKASCNDSFGQSTWHGSLHVPPNLSWLGGLVGVNLIVAPTGLPCVESVFFYLLHIFGTKWTWVGSTTFPQTHRKTRVSHVESKQLDTWRYAIDIQRFARGHRRAKLSGTLRSRPFWMKRSLENHRVSFDGTQIFFWGGIRFKLDAKMLLVVFKGICPLRIVREVWFGN